VFVACSTLCFSRYPLEQALQVIAELEFSKLDVAVHEQGAHLRPSEVAADVAAAAHRLRLGVGLTPAVFSLEIGTAEPAEFRRLLQAVCRLARICAVPLVTMSAAATGTGLDAETERLAGLVRLAGAEGILIAVDTRIGTLTEDPVTAAELCERITGLGLALDPSHYVAGPHQVESLDDVLPYVRHVRLRDTGRGPNQFQVRVGQGEIEYGRLVSQLSRHGYERALSVDIRDIPDAPFPMEPEVRKLKYLLESLV
jgi:sugar phosphate isomerase/epimerase